MNKGVQGLASASTKGRRIGTVTPEKMLSMYMSQKYPLWIQS